MKRPSTRSLVVWSIIALIAGLAVYQFKFAPLAVVAHTVARGEIVAESMGTGTLEARVKTTISPRIQERLLEVLVDQGDAVKSGQLLARLDDAESKQQVAIAEATLAAAKRTAERVHADLARSEAVLAQAKLDQDRMAGLVATRAVSQSDADKSAEALRIAEADLNRSHAAIAEAEGQIVVAGKNLLYRQEQLAFTQIHSPYDGLVIRRERDAGDMLVPGGTLMQLISLDGPLGRQVMELFAKIAHEKNAGVIVVTHDHRTLDVFDRILDVEDGMIQSREAPPASNSPAA